MVTCICPLCVAVVDRDQTVNPRVSVPDFGPTCLARWRKNIKHTCYHLHLCANTISWKLALERDLRAECFFISTEARVPSLRKRDCVCGLPVRLRVARECSATFIAAISDKNGEKDVKMLWTSVQSRVWVALWRSSYMCKTQKCSWKVWSRFVCCCLEMISPFSSCPQEW